MSETATLHEAFALFSKETTRLEREYKALQKEFHTLSHQLADSNRRLEQVITYMKEGLMAIGSQGQILLCNGAIAQMTKVPECVGKLFEEVFPDELFGFSMKQALLEKGFERLSCLTLHEREFEVTASLVPSIGMLLTCRDVTELRHLRQTAGRNDRLRDIGEMAASLAHEIRNPLGGIEGFAALLARDLEGKEREMARSIIEGARLLNRLVTNTLAYAKPISCQFRLAQLDTIIEEAIAFFNAALPERAVIFKCGSTRTLQADADLLKNALLNVLFNAHEASPQEEAICISLDEEEQLLAITVMDRGVGIPEHHLEKIFTPFFTTKVKGTGLGLSEVQKVVHAHGGSVTVESKNGTIFTIRLPCPLNVS